MENIAYSRKLQIPDARRLATAITYKVNEMHTFDDKLLDLDESVRHGGN